MKCLEFREMLLVSPRFKAVSELVAEGSIKIFYTIFVVSSVQFAESAKGQMSGYRCLERSRAM